MSKNPGLMFLTKWLKSPLTVASVTPSSPQLAKAMANCLPDGDGLVVELGGGTGPITQALTHHVKNPEHLVVLERDQHFYEFLRGRFPGNTIIKGDALELSELIGETFPGVPVRAVVSGLPLLSMSGSLQRGIVEQALTVAGKGGRFIQFSYGLSSPVKKSIAKDLNLSVNCAAHVWRNVPPAKVWVYEQNSVRGLDHKSQKVVPIHGSDVEVSV